MIDIEKLQSTHEKIRVPPSDRIFSELGNNTYDFKDLMSELIDNSIAARRLDRVLNISIEMWVDSRNNPEKIIVRDDAKGIPKEEMGTALSPAAVQTPNSLNEHGLGMKQAIAGLGKLVYIATRTGGEERARVVRELKFGDIDYFLSDFDQDSGTEICITDIKPIANATPQSITMTLVPYLGARYRRYLPQENKRINISIYLSTQSVLAQGAFSILGMSKS